MNVCEKARIKQYEYFGLQIDTAADESEDYSDIAPLLESIMHI